MLHRVRAFSLEQTESPWSGGSHEGSSPRRPCGLNCERASGRMVLSKLRLDCNQCRNQDVHLGGTDSRHQIVARNSRAICTAAAVGSRRDVVEVMVLRGVVEGIQVSDGVLEGALPCRRAAGIDRKSV